jgi:AcrR family transcriptional regulator
MQNYVREATEKKDTQHQILDAAVEVFAEKGYHDTRVDDIVAASGTSKGSVYFHFASKEQIFFSVIDEFANRLAKGLMEAINSESQGIRRVNAALQKGLDTFGRYRPLAKIFLVQATGLGESFEQKRYEIHDRFVKIIKGYLDQAIEEEDIPMIDTEVAALAWMGAINEVVIRWVLTGEPSPTRALPTLRTLLLRSVGVSEERILEFEAE